MDISASGPPNGGERSFGAAKKKRLGHRKVLIVEKGPRDVGGVLPRERGAQHFTSQEKGDPQEEEKENNARGVKWAVQKRESSLRGRDSAEAPSKQ